MAFASCSIIIVIVIIIIISSSIIIIIMVRSWPTHGSHFGTQRAISLRQPA